MTLSLKTFHIVFVSLSTLLSVGFGLWAVRQYMDAGSAGLLATAVGSLAFAAVLICYGVWFLRKLRNVRSL